MEGQVSESWPANALIATTTQTSVSVELMPEEERMDLIWSFIIYILNGLILISFNFIVLAALLSNANLRSQYVVLCGLLFTDGLMGCACLAAGYGRNKVLLSNTQNDLVSRRDCMLKLWNLLFIWVDPMTAIMLMVVSIDRLLLLLFPILYHKRSTFLGVCQLMVAHLYMLVSVCIGWLLAFPDTKVRYQSICWSSKGIAPEYFKYHTYLRILAAIASVVLYFAVVLLMFFRMKKIASVSASSKNFTKKQKQFTISMGISCFFTTIFYVIPICLELYTVVYDMEDAGSFSFIMSYANILGCLNSVLNVLIVLVRHDDIRKAVVSFMCRGTFLTSNDPKMQTVMPMQSQFMKRANRAAIPAVAHGGLQQRSHSLAAHVANPKLTMPDIE